MGVGWQLKTEDGSNARRRDTLCKEWLRIIFTSRVKWHPYWDCIKMALMGWLALVQDSVIVRLHDTLQFTNRWSKSNKDAT